MTITLSKTRPVRHAVDVPDPEVPQVAKRRRFSAEYKLKILAEAEACTEPGEVGALLRREGLYSSHLSAWRKQARQGLIDGLDKKRGRKRKDPLIEENERLRREKEKLEKRLAQAQAVIEVQKKLSEVLGVDLPSEDEGQRS
jgi:transposase